jgi:hypothetical protein
MHYLLHKKHLNATQAWQDTDDAHNQTITDELR